MRKPVLVGGGLALLLLGFVAGALWVNGNGTDAVAPSASHVVNRQVSPPPEGRPLPSTFAGADPHAQDAVRQARQERRRRLSEVRAEFNAMRAQGAKASPAKMRALVDELEAVSPPGFDPRYFQALRNMLDASTKVQALNAELQDSLKSKSPQDVARQEELLGQMRTLGQQVAKDAQDLQTYAPSPLPRPQSP